MKSSPDPLDSVLGAWRIAPPRDPQFRGQVWSRIQGSRSALTWFGYVRNHATAVVVAFALAAVVGIFSGRERARADLEAESGRMASAYVKSLDARTMLMP